MKQYRIKEYSEGVFSIEEKCWFLWRPIVERSFRGSPIIATHNTRLKATLALKRYKNSKNFMPKYVYEK